MTSLLALAAAFALMPLLGGGILAYYAAWLMLSLVGGGTTPLVWTGAVVGRFAAARGRRDVRCCHDRHGDFAASGVNIAASPARLFRKRGSGTFVANRIEASTRR